MPTEYGGAGASFFCSVLAIEELAKVDASVSVFCDVQNTLVFDLFRSYGSRELQDKYYPLLTSDLVRAGEGGCIGEGRRGWLCW